MVGAFLSFVAQFYSVGKWYYIDTVCASNARLEEYPRCRCHYSLYSSIGVASAMLNSDYLGFSPVVSTSSICAVRSSLYVLLGCSYLLGIILGLQLIFILCCFLITARVIALTCASLRADVLNTHS